MSPDVRHLVVTVIGVRFNQIAYNLACTETEQLVFRKISFVDKGVEDDKYKITVKTVGTAYFRDRGVAGTEVDTKTVDDRNH